MPAHTGLSIFAVARVGVTLAETETVIKFDVPTEVDKEDTLEVITHLTILPLDKLAVVYVALFNPTTGTFFYFSR